MKPYWDNGIAQLALLCRPCHQWVHSRKNTKGEWVGAFQKTLLE